MRSFDLFSIGHSNIAAERFLVMLCDVGLNAVADVRSVPASRHFPWFSKSNLAAQLAAAGIAYTTMGDALGGRPREARLYRDGVADYEAMAREPQFLAGLDRLTEAAARSRICLLCAEREPLDCHRCLLVGRRLAERRMTIGHILHDSTIEVHAATEARLLVLDEPARTSGARDLFDAGQDDRLAAAYRRRAHTVAFRQKVPPRGAAEK